MRRLLAEMQALPNTAEDKAMWEQLYNQMWMLRESIAETPAKTPVGVIEQIALAIEMHEGGSTLSDTEVKALRTAIASLQRMS